MRLTLSICAVVGLIYLTSLAGTVGLPTEHFTLPEVNPTHLYVICIWDETAQSWATNFAHYDKSGKFDFHVPAWDQWYWVGLWDANDEQYVFGKWVGHFRTN